MVGKTRCERGKRCGYGAGPRRLRASSRALGRSLVADWRRQVCAGAVGAGGQPFESRVYGGGRHDRPGRVDGGGGGGGSGGGGGGGGGGGLRGRRERDAALSCVKLGDRVGRSLIVPASELLSHVHTHRLTHTHSHTHLSLSLSFSLSLSLSLYLRLSVSLLPPTHLPRFSVSL